MAEPHTNHGFMSPVDHPTSTAGHEDPHGLAEPGRVAERARATRGASSAGGAAVVEATEKVAEKKHGIFDVEPWFYRGYNHYVIMILIGFNGCLKSMFNQQLAVLIIRVLQG